MLPTKFWFIWLSGIRIKDFKKSTNQKQELPVAAKICYRYREPLIDVMILAFHITLTNSVRFFLYGFSYMVN
jgi:hypothetical protein